MLAQTEIDKPKRSPVHDAVDHFLTSTTSFRHLSSCLQEQIARDTVHVVDYLVGGRPDGAFQLVGAVDFPGFVADLIKGTFNATIDSSIRQMEAYAELIRSVASSLDEFQDNTISDAEARERLATSIPALSGGEAKAANPSPSSRRQLLATMVMMGVNRVVGSDDRPV